MTRSDEETGPLWDDMSIAEDYTSLQSRTSMLIHDDVVAESTFSTSIHVGAKVKDNNQEKNSRHNCKLLYMHDSTASMKCYIFMHIVITVNTYI